jgi:hypothetical protein
MPTTLPIEIYDILERKVGRDDAREIGKVIEFSFDAIERKAEAETKLGAAIDKFKTGIVSKLDKLDARFRIYFLILMFTIIILNPKSIELLSKLPGIFK